MAQVTVPAPLRERTNWLVQVPPPYAVTVPLALPKKRAPGTEETVRFVVEAFVEVIAVVEAFGKVEATTAPEVIAPFDPIVVVAVPPIAN